MNKEGLWGNHSPRNYSMSTRTSHVRVASAGQSSRIVIRRVFTAIRPQLCAHMTCNWNSYRPRLCPFEMAVHIRFVTSN